MVECGSVVIFGRSLVCVCVCARVCVCVCMYPCREEQGGKWNGGGGPGPGTGKGLGGAWEGAKGSSDWADFRGGGGRGIWERRRSNLWKRVTTWSGGSHWGSPSKYEEASLEEALRVVEGGIVKRREPTGMLASLRR